MRMAEPRELSNPPLREAVIDIRVVHEHDFDRERIHEVRQVVEHEYPTVQQQWVLEGQIHIGKDAQRVPPGRRRLNGLIFQDAETKQVAQFRADGFSFSRLAPYTDWDDVFPEAMRLWGIYLDVIPPQYVSRLAVRYINAIEVSPPVDLQEYFTAPPYLPDDAPTDALSTFLMRTTSTFSDWDISVHMTHASEDVGTDGVVTIVLDLDVFKNVELRPEKESETLRLQFERLREVKNRMFFASITNTLVGRYE